MAERARAGATIHVQTSAIVVDESIYPRTAWDADTVTRYFHALEAGRALPPIVVGKRDDTLVLLDGRHRLRAQQRRQAVSVDALVSAATPEEFFAEAVRLNAAHGTPLSAPEILAAIQRLDGAGYIPAAIAQLVALPVGTVSRVLVAALPRPRAVQRGAAPFHPVSSSSGKLGPEPERIERALESLAGLLVTMEPRRVTCVYLEAWLQRLTSMQERLNELRTQKIRQERAGARA